MNTSASAGSPRPTTDAEVAASSTTHVAEGLRSVLRAALSDAEGIDVRSLQRVSGGRSREHWTFRASWTDRIGSHDRWMVLCRESSGGLMRSDRALEFRLLRALERTSFPAPRALFLDAGGDLLGRPGFVMDRVEGRCDWDVLSANRPLADRLALARDFLGLLTRLHSIDIGASGLEAVLHAPAEEPSSVELDRWERELREVQLEPFPELELAIVWLRERMPRTRTRVLVHGDFKPGNIVHRDGRAVALLDWETAHLGDPLEDLGWMLNPTRSREHQLPGCWEHARIVDAYESATGHTVDSRALHWWIVFANFKLATITLTGVREFVEGRLDRVYVAPTWIVKRLIGLIGEAE